MKITKILNTPGSGYASYAVVDGKQRYQTIVQHDGKEYHLGPTFITTAQTAHELKCAVGTRVAGIASVVSASNHNSSRK